MSYKTEKSSVPTWEGKVYVGSRVGYDGPAFSEDEVKLAVNTFQHACSVNACVRMSRCRFTHKEYDEAGWELGVINYPRFPKTVQELESFTLGLAEHLVGALKQNRVSAVMPERTVMFAS